MSIILIGKQSEVRKYLNRSMTKCPDGFGLMYFDKNKRGKDGTMGQSVVYRTLDPFKFKYFVKKIDANTKIAVHCRYATKQAVKEKNCFPQASLTMGVSLMCGEDIKGVEIPNNEQTVAAHYWLRDMELKYHIWEETKTHLGEFGITECMVFMDRTGKFNILNSELGEETESVWVYSQHGKAETLYIPREEKVVENRKPTFNSVRTAAWNTIKDAGREVNGNVWNTASPFRRTTVSFYGR